VQFRQGGEQFKPAGNSHHRKLKQLFQLWRVPVWKRDIIPLVYCQDQLIVVWGYGCSR
ncbi:MAG TPA: tRNA(Ile)-lysidine synthetase, partial [Gammaproteobacteria bacterium]|nr:tRNA(Ile)-lysidine synthetase [Gammaproteobacteria bacterium]